ncbi:MAG: hypothetical protein LUQ32_00670 [Methanomicrobiales archaeon]|nr:hypothetical protein [Methanomicrobiales archaeon]
MISTRFYRIYDIGREIDLDWLEQELAQSYFTARTSFTRLKQKSIMIEDASHHPYAPGPGGAGWPSL